MPQSPPRLLAVPYTPPSLRRGDRATCPDRDADVTVTSWTAAPIPWPRCCRPGTHGGGSGLLVTKELARAVRSESVAAVCHWWGVTPAWSGAGGRRWAWGCPTASSPARPSGQQRHGAGAPITSSPGAGPSNTGAVGAERRLTDRLRSLLDWLECEASKGTLFHQKEPPPMLRDLLYPLRTPRRPSCRPKVEPLEHRHTPSTTVLSVSPNPAPSARRSP